MSCAINDISRLGAAAPKSEDLSRFKFVSNYSHYKLDYIEVAGFLSEFPQGFASTQGPGKGSDWWPNEPPAKRALFDHFAENLFAPLRGYGHPVYSGASEVIYAEMDRYQVKNQGNHEHFDATAKKITNRPSISC